MTPVPAAKPRLSAKLRKAIELRVRKGTTISDACAEAGMSTQGWYKAMKRVPVQDYLTEVTEKFVAEADRLRTYAKIVAIESALDLLKNAKSEAVKARMIEFLASDGKVSPVAVHIDARQQAVGYEYITPGARIVEIEAQPAAIPPETSPKPS